jgi:hypothetical protein
MDFLLIPNEDSSRVDFNIQERVRSRKQVRHRHCLPPTASYCRLYPRGRAVQFIVNNAIVAFDNSKSPQ